ncbi:hypothetical protein PMAYCL1PPCAC_14123 [Pristionchus mayeri]|uniref:Uncharacterized protein n=1 Tax=Pristionchus mayeri TaxID=1317129 RepID=A0AAN4ZMG0_9BILA|nr:hypothetical protein PMAYCL1PPCAC_14123 [Pristionchus mayeri]
MICTKRSSDADPIQFLYSSTTRILVSIRRLPCNKSIHMRREPEEVSVSNSKSSHVGRGTPLILCSLSLAKSMPSTYLHDFSPLF